MLCTCCSNGWHESNISCALKSALWVQRKRIKIPTDIRFHVLVVMTNILWRLNQSHSKVNLFRGAPYAFSSERQNYSWNDNIFHCYHSELMVCQVQNLSATPYGNKEMYLQIVERSAHISIGWIGIGPVLLSGRFSAVPYSFVMRNPINSNFYCKTGVWLKGELWCKINLWSNKTMVPSQPFSEICFHDNRM